MHLSLIDHDFYPLPSMRGCSNRLIKPMMIFFVVDCNTLQFSKLILLFGCFLVKQESIVTNAEHEKIFKDTAITNVDEIMM